MTAAWTGVSAAQHDARSHVGTPGIVTGGQSPIAALVPSNLPTVGAITLLTDVAGQITALRNGAETRLDALEAKVNAILAALVASGVLGG